MGHRLFKTKRDKITLKSLDNLEIFYEEMENPITYRLRKLQGRAQRRLRTSS